MKTVERKKRNRRLGKTTRQCRKKEGEARRKPNERKQKRTTECELACRRRLIEGAKAERDESTEGVERKSEKIQWHLQMSFL